VGCPKPLPHAPEIGKVYKGHLLFILLFFKILERLKVGATTPIQLKLNSMPIHAISTHFQVFFIATMDPIITSVTEQDPVSNEEALIDRDSDVFDTEITISPISVSRVICLIM
jgi:hypothetical protein